MDGHRLNPHRLNEALGLVLGAPDHPADAAVIEHFLAYLRAQRLQVDWHQTVEQRGVMVAAAIGICSLINAFSPQRVLLGGGITQAGKSLFEPLQEMVDLFEWRPKEQGVPIQAAKFLKWSGAYGAAAAALYRDQYLGK